MAQPDLNLSFAQSSEDISVGTVTDITDDYGQGSVEARADAANYLLWAKTDQDGNRTFYNPVPGNVLAVMAWSIATELDGWYQGILLRIQPYNNSAAYLNQQESEGEITRYPGIVYYPAEQKVYMCIEDSTGNLPTDTDFWEEVIDFSDLILNTNVQVKIVDFMTHPRASRFASTEMGKLDDESFVNRNDKQRKFAYKLRGLIISAESEFAQGNPEEMQKIIAQVNSEITT